MIELNICWEFIWMFRNIILEESDEFCFLSSKDFFFWADISLSYVDSNWSWILLHIFKVFLV